MLIRQAKPEDWWCIEKVAPEIHGETRFKDTFLDLTKIKSFFDMQETTDDLICLLAFDEDELIGLGAFLISEQFWNKTLVSNDLMLWVTKERRGSSTAYRLVKEYEIWAKGRGVNEITLGINTGIDVDKTSSFFNRLGYIEQAKLFTKDN